MKALPYYQQHRMEWIAESLRVFGFINRAHIMRKFGLSTPQASLDLRTFQRLHPEAVHYDLSAKCFISADQTAVVTVHFRGKQ